MKTKFGIFSFIRKHKVFIAIVLLLSLHIFLRFSDTETKNSFAWDQVRDAWMSLDLIENNKYPLLGMVAKQNTGIYMGPIYYYFIAPFYFFTNLDPIASGIAAGFVNVFTFFGLFYIVKKLFSFRVALFATFINTIAMASIGFDRTQWSVSPFPLVSLAIFYFLYKVITGYPKYLIYLAIAAGIAFHLHFTAIFFPIIILCSLPFFPRTKKTLKYILFSIPLFLIWLLPNFLAELQTKNVHTGNLFNYVGVYYHGFHLKRFLQLSPDAFIQFEGFLPPLIKILKYVIVPIFFLIYLSRNVGNSMKFFFLVCLWYLVPWVVFSTYKGEISDYYFSINRYVGIAILAYLLNFVFERKQIVLKVAVLTLLYGYGYLNIINFFLTTQMVD